MKNQTIADAINSMFVKRKTTEGVVPRVKPVHCVNGLSLSIQASRLHYCYPRNNEGPYEEFEVGFPSQKPPESWRERCIGDFENKACESVYANVSLSQIVEFIELHGGIKSEQVPQFILPEPKQPVKRNFLEQRRFNLTMQDMGLAV